MLKSYLSAKGISAYRLAKESHILYSTLNDLMNHKLLIDYKPVQENEVLAPIHDAKSSDWLKKW